MINYLTMILQMNGGTPGNCLGWTRTIAYQVIYALPTELQGNHESLILSRLQLLYSP